MNISSYDIASNYGNYGSEKTLPASSKPFTIPTLEIPDKNSVVSAKISTQLSGTVSMYKKCNYNPFKDMAMTGSVNLPEYMQTKTTPLRSI